MKSAGKKKRADNSIRLPMQVIILSACLVAVSFIGMLVLTFYLSDIRKDYEQVFKKDFDNLQYVTSINETFYKHQADIYKYMTSLDESDEISEIESEAKSLMNKIINQDRMLADNVIHTSYESEYHKLHSSLNGYEKDVDYIFSFTNAGDEATAEYYMETTLDASIDEIMEHVDTLYTLITKDANTSKDELSRRLQKYQNIELALILFISAVSLTGLVHGIFITYDIVNKDAMTGVYNVGKMRRHINKLKRLKKLKGYFSICTNIKGLSLVNQRFSSHTGDMVLKNYAKTMKSKLKKGEMMARIGGDNFFYFVKKENVEEIVGYLVKLPISIATAAGVKNIVLENRCGIYEIEEKDNFDLILDSGYIAVNQAKIPNNPNVIRFDKGLLDKVFERKYILTQFKNGLARGEFVAYYQPKVNTEGNRVCGAEALVRWVQDGKVVPPFKFIPVLENEGSVIELDFYVFERMCADQREWIDKGLTPVRISSNFSKVHLQNETFSDRILSIIEKYHIPSELIEIELTESSGYENIEALTRFVNKMNEYNIYVAIDDFGTGYSSLSMLKNLKVNVVKLDKSLVDGIGSGDAVTEGLVRNVIHLIKDMNHEIICEGVETGQQSEFLKQEKCFLVQGYLYDKPLPHDEFEKRLVKPEYE